MKIDVDADRLLALAKSRPRGFTYREACGKFRWDRVYFYAVVRRVRMLLGEDEMTLVCRPENGTDPWTYRLVGTPEKARWWGLNRVTDAESRIETMASAMGSVSKATDARTIAGRKARIIHRGLTRISEDLGDIEGRF